MIALVSVFTCQIPFFGDMTYISQVAHFIFDNGLSKIINPEIDNGTPPLFSFYLASGWLILGKKLWIAHLLILPIYLGLIYQLYKLGLKFASKNTSLIAVSLLLIDPTFSTQFLLMGYDIAIVFFFLLGLNSIIDKKYIFLIISTIFISLLNLRGFSIVLGLFIIEVYYWKNYNIKAIIKSGIVFIPAFIAVISWLSYHYSIMDWIAVNSSNTNLHGIQGLNWAAKNFVFELLALSGNGRIFVLGLSSALLIILFLKKQVSQLNELKQLVIITVLAVLPFFALFTAMKYPVGPRYFMVSYPLIYLGLVMLIHQFQSIKLKASLLSLIAILIIASNFWMNPYPYSNSWDSSLKVLAYFKIQEELIEKIQADSIPPKSIYTSFPLHKNLKLAYVNPELDIHFQDFDIEKIKIGDYVIYSNIYNHLELGNELNQPLNSTLVFEKKQMGAWMKMYKISK